MGLRYGVRHEIIGLGKPLSGSARYDFSTTAPFL
jgi:hypothetical protein